MAQETIIRAAIQVGETVYHMSPPARHHTVLHTYKLGRVMHNQGFLTNTGRYVDRKEALAIALAANQIAESKRTTLHERLYSEDLW